MEDFSFFYFSDTIIKEQVVYFRFSSLSLSLFGIVVKTTTEVLEQNNKKSVFDRLIDPVSPCPQSFSPRRVEL